MAIGWSGLYMEISFILRSIRRFWLVVLLAALACSALTFTYASKRTVLYSAKTRVLFAPLASDDRIDPKYVDNQVSILRSGTFLRTVAGQFPGESLRSLLSKSSVQVVGGTDVADIQVIDLKADQAEAIANAFTDNLLTELKSQATGRNERPLGIIKDQLKALDEALTTLEQKRLNIGEPQTQSDRNRLGEVAAKISTLEGERRNLASRQQELQLFNNLEVRTEVIQEPVSEKLPRHLGLYGGIGLFLGAGLGSLLALLLAYGPRRIVSDNEIVDLFGAAPAATIGSRRSLRNPIWMKFRPMPISLTGEIDRLCVRIESTASNASDSLKVLVTAPQAGSGTTTLASAIAQRFAERGSMTILADLDLANPAISRVWDPDGTSGLSAMLQKDVQTKNTVLTPTDILDLRILSQGDQKLASKWLPRAGTTKTVEGLSKLTEVLVIDGGSLRDLSTSVRLAQLCDVVVLALPEDGQGIPDLTFATRSLRTQLSQVLVVMTKPAAGGAIQRALGMKPPKLKRHAVR
jgi:protein-tyrosine kinase